MRNNIKQQELFEAYYYGQLDNEAHEAFTKRLSEEPELADDYQTFCLLIAGIDEYAKEELKQNLDEDIDYQIFRFLNGKMSSEEKQVFEARLKEEEELVELVEEHKQIAAVIPDISTEPHEPNKKDEPSTNPPNIKPLFPWKQILSLAAAISFLLFIGNYIISSGQLNNNLVEQAEKALNAYDSNRIVEYQNDENKVNIEGYTPAERKDIDEALSQVVKAVNDEDYRQAEALLGDLAQKNLLAKTELGMLLIQQRPLQPQKIREGINILSGLEEEIELSEEIRWTLVMGYVLSGDKLSSNAQEILEELAEEETSPYKEKAQKILSLMHKE